MHFDSRRYDHINNFHRALQFTQDRKLKVCCVKIRQHLCKIALAT